MRQGASPQLSEHLPDDFGLSAFRFVEAICISTPVVMEVMEHIRMVEWQSASFKGPTLGSKVHADIKQSDLVSRGSFPVFGMTILRGMLLFA